MGRSVRLLEKEFPVKEALLRTIYFLAILIKVCGSNLGEVYSYPIPKITQTDISTDNP